MQTPLTIGQFNDGYLPVTDGVVTVVRNYAYWLNEKYGKCVVYAPNAKHYQNEESFDVQPYLSMPIPGRKPYRLGFPVFDASYRRQVDSMQFDLVHSHSPFSAGSEALRVAKKQHIPLVGTFHSKFYDDFVQYFHSDHIARAGVNFVIKFFQKCDSVWTVSDATVETLREYGYQGPITVINNGTDLAAPETQAEIDDAKQQAEALCSLRPDQPLFVFVGQHIWQKNVRLILEAAEQLRHIEPDFRLVFVGTGYAQHDMQAFIDEHAGMAQQVSLLGTIQNRTLLSYLYLRASAFVFPSVYDNAPLVVREASAMGTPSILIQGSTAAQGVEDKVNGFLCQNSVESLRDTMLYCLQHPQQAQEIGKKAQKTLAKSWSMIVDQVYEEYLRIIENYKAKNQ